LEDLEELYDILIDSWKQAAPADLAESLLPPGPRPTDPPSL
jgi:hypothetical protein